MNWLSSSEMPHKKFGRLRCCEAFFYAKDPGGPRRRGVGTLGTMAALGLDEPLDLSMALAARGLDSASNLGILARSANCFTEPTGLSSSWRAQGRHPGVAVQVVEKAWMAGLRPP